MHAEADASVEVDARVEADASAVADARAEADVSADADASAVTDARALADARALRKCSVTTHAHNTTCICHTLPLASSAFHRDGTPGYFEQACTEGSNLKTCYTQAAQVAFHQLDSIVSGHN